MAPRFFKTPNDFRGWLESHHRDATELLVGFYKVGSGKPSITWKQSVDEALCFGWIDGVRKRIDDASYSIRFTPRKPKSYWSVVNVKRAGELIAAGRMTPSGLATFSARDPEKSKLYSFEARNPTLDPAYQQKLKANRAAWDYFQAEAPWYRRTLTHWVMSAKKEETRVKRLETLIAGSAKGRRVGVIPAKR